MTFYDIVSWMQANPLEFWGGLLVAVVGIGVYFERMNATAALPKVAPAPATASPTPKSSKPDDILKVSPGSPVKQAEPEQKSSFSDQAWKTEPHNVVANVLQSASAAVQTAKDVSTPDAPEHVKEAAKALTAAAVKTLDVVAPAVKAAVEEHSKTEEKAPEDKAPDGKVRMTADEWLKGLNDTAGAARRTMGHDEGEKHGD